MSIHSIKNIDSYSFKKSKKKCKNYQGGSVRWCDQLLYQQYKFHKELQIKASGEQIIIEKHDNLKECDNDYKDYQVWKKEIVDDEKKTQSTLKMVSITVEIFVIHEVGISIQKAQLAQQESMLWLKENKLINYSKSVKVRYFDETLHNAQELSNIYMLDGLGVAKYKSGMVYCGEWKNGKQHGHGVRHDSLGNNYQGQFEEGLPNGYGKWVYSNGNSYEGQWIDNMRHGNGKYVYSNGNIYLGEWRDNNQHGKGKIIHSNGEINQGDFHNGTMHGRIITSSVYNYTSVGYFEYNLMEGPHIYDNEQIFYFKKSKLYNIDFNIKNYIIQNPYKNYSNYITIIINLHGSDKINTNCKLINDDNHVRILSPVSCGRINLIGSDIKNVFNTVFNVCNINKDASTYQKMEKMLELINRSDMIHQINYDRHIVLPEIDHRYSLDNDTDKNNIFLVETNFNPIISGHSFIDQKLYQQVNEEFTELYKYDDIKQFNILPQILEVMKKKSSWTNWITKKVISHYYPKVFFYRSVLINSLLALGYQTINILDFSCRNITASEYDTLIGDYHNKHNKYVCNSSKEPNQHIEREIVSIKY